MSVLTVTTSSPAGGFDGHCANETDGTFSSLVTGNGTQGNTQANLNCLFSATSSTDVWSEVRRVMMSFDTSALTASAEIDSATLTFELVGSTDNYNQSVNITAANPVGEIVVASDYQTVSNTRLASDYDITNLPSNGSLFTLTLNAAGLAYISKTGYTEFALRMGADIDNSSPTWVAFQSAVVTVRGDTSADNPPSLAITYNTNTSTLFNMT